MVFPNHDPESDNMNGYVSPVTSVCPSEIYPGQLLGKKSCGHLESPVCSNGEVLYLRWSRTSQNDPLPSRTCCNLYHLPPKKKKKAQWPLLQPFKSTDNRLGQDSAVWHMLFPKPRFRSAPGQKRVLQQIQCLPGWALCPADPGPGDQE